MSKEKLWGAKKEEEEVWRIWCGMKRINSVSATCLKRFISVEILNRMNVSR
jgi:hypothetical protein